MPNDDDGNDSDYIVEEYIRPNKISRIPVNDASGDILGNFDDSKRDKNGDLINEEEIDEEHSNCDDDDDDDDDDDSSCNGNDQNEIISDNYNNNNFDNSNNNEKNNLKLLKSINSNSITNIKKMNPFIERENHNNIKGNNPFKTGKLTDDAVKNLLRGVSKSNRYVLYVTNIDCQTTKNDLDEHFQKAGQIKNIRIPKKCLSNKNNINKFRNLFAFVEMCTLDGFKNALQLHNTELNGKLIKIQISEGGKKKSANKKNILKQKNRKLSELRMEYKSFTKSGKNYDKNLKKEISKDYLHKNKMNKWKTIKRAK